MTLPDPPTTAESGVADFQVACGAPPLSPEIASALAVRAACSDLEYWAMGASTPEGCIGLNDLIQALDLLRNTTGSVIVDSE
jgi:hypothetical protein